MSAFPYILMEMTHEKEALLEEWRTAVRRARFLQRRRQRAYAEAYLRRCNLSSRRPRKSA
jgi:hypothetical protein